jgi:tRNA(fMet)-specific endonuclease VapC
MSATIPLALLDTDILSAVMRQFPPALAHAQAYLAVHHHLTFSSITRYEILRGLHAKNATVQLAAFELLCDVSRILPLTDAIVMRAATIYADLHQHGTLIGDADILIAATSLEHGLVVVTNNEKHYRRIADIQLDNWLV